MKKYGYLVASQTQKLTPLKEISLLFWKRDASQNQSPTGKNLPAYELKGIFQSDYESATVTFAWAGQPRPEGFIDPTSKNKYYSFELRRRKKKE